MGIISYYLFYIRNDYNFKAKFYPFFVVFFSVLFVAFAFLMGASINVMLVIVPFAALFAWLNIRKTTICKHCAKMIFNYDVNSRMKVCPRCRNNLD
jgi:hypothetical protein